MRKILLFTTLSFSLLAGAQETASSKKDTSSRKTGTAVRNPHTGCSKGCCRPDGKKKEPLIANPNYLCFGSGSRPGEITRMPEEVLKAKMLASSPSAKPSGSATEGVIFTPVRKEHGYIVVRDGEDKKPLASASLVFNECYQMIDRIAGEDGRVDTKGITTGRMPVEVSCIGYKKKTLLLDITENSVHEIELERDYDTLEQVIIVSPHTIRCGRTIRGCSGAIIDCIIISTTDTVSPAPPANPTRNHLQVYPNPSRSYASIYLRLPLETGSRLQAELLNSSGQLIKTSILQPGKATNARFDLPQLSSGMYYVRVTDADLGKRYVGNLVVE
jgi:hypothetical protein